MPIRSLVYGVTGRIMASAGLLRPWVGRVRRAPGVTHLGFFALAIALAAATVSTWAAHSATPASDSTAGLRGPGFISASVTLFAFAWLVSYWTSGQRRALLLGWTVAAAGIVLLALVVTVLSNAQDALVVWGSAAIPYSLPIAWLVVVIVTGWQLAGEVRRASGDLAASNLQLRAVVDERTRALLRSEADLASRVDELNLLHEIARVRTTVQELEPALSDVLAATCALLRAQSGLLTLQPWGGDPAVTVAWFAVEPDAELRGQRIAELSQLATRHSSDRRPAGLIVAPLPQREGSAGLLVLARGAQAPFSYHEQRLAASVGTDVTELVARHRLAAALRASATEQERQRIARELHDSVTQTLYAVSIIADALPQTYERDPGAGRRATQQVRELMLTALSELRALLLELRPASLDKAGLAQLVHEQAGAFTARYRVPADVVVANEPRVGMEEKLAIYRAVRELLSNVARHADATRVTLHLRTLPAGGGRLDVVDDGRGFEPSGVDGDHHGLAIVRERFAAMGGTLAVTSVRGEGTHVVLEWT